LGYLSMELFGNYLLAIIGFIGIFIFASISYIITYLKYKDNTATTEITSIIVYVLGVMCIVGFFKIAVIFGVIVAGLLTFKKGIHKIPERIKKNELFSVMGFAIISLVILPLLPNKNYSPADSAILSNILTTLGIHINILRQLDVFNFYNMWLMVILVSGISFLGYILVKFFGTEKGYGLSGFVGGLFSSTAVTISMAGESKKHRKMVNPFVIAVVVASATSFIRIIIEVVIINNNILGAILIPLGIMGLFGYASAFVLYLKHEKKTNKKEIKINQPFALIPAIKFGLFFLFIIFIIRLLQILIGSTGLYIASIVSGFADVDAITLTMSSLSRSGEIMNTVAVTSIVLAAASNTLIKGAMAWFLGEKKFALYISIIFLFILALGIITLFLI